MNNRYWLLSFVLGTAAALLAAMAFTLEPSAQSRAAAADRCRVQARLGGHDGAIAADAVRPGVMDAQLTARVTVLREAGLTEDQAASVGRIMEEHDGYDFELTGAILAEHATLLVLAGQPLPDPLRVGASYANIAKLQQRMVEADVAFWNRVYGLLDLGQREHVRTACGETAGSVAGAIMPVRVS